MFLFYFFFIIRILYSAKFPLCFFDLSQGYMNKISGCQCSLCFAYLLKLIISFLKTKYYYTAIPNRVEQGTSRERITLRSSHDFPTCSLFYPVQHCSPLQCRPFTLFKCLSFSGALGHRLPKPSTNHQQWN